MRRSASIAAATTAATAAHRHASRCEQLEPVVVHRFFLWLARLDRQTAQAGLTELEASTIAEDGADGRAVAGPGSDSELAAGCRASETAWCELARSARLALVLELPDLATLREQWKSLSVCERRHILAAANATVTVRPADLTAQATSHVRIQFTGGRAGRGRARAAPR